VLGSISPAPYSHYINSTALNVSRWRIVRAMSACISPRVLSIAWMRIHYASAKLNSVRQVKMKYFYQIKFNDGKVIRRENLTKTLAESMFNAMEFEMLLFNVDSVTWGKMLPS